MNRTIRIGTRGSQLALYQANRVKDLLSNKYPSQEFEISIIKTKGDKILDVALSKIGDKGLFTKEIEDLLLKGFIDMAVHSLKDLPTSFPEGLSLGGVLERGEVRDALVSRNGLKLQDLTKHHIIATSSLRRRAQLLAYNPGLTIVDIRGNVNTRLKKMDEGYCDSMILAATGLERLGLENRITEYLNPSIMVPAVSQGIIGVETREGDDDVLKLLADICDKDTMEIATAERNFLRGLEGGCQVPIACYSEKDGENYKLTGYISNVKGENIIKKTVAGNVKDVSLVNQLVQEFIEKGAKEILQQVREDNNPIK